MLFQRSERLTLLICHQELRDFIVSGVNAVFENRRRHTRANKYWPLFLSQLLKDKGIDGLKVGNPLRHIRLVLLLTPKDHWF